MLKAEDAKKLTEQYFENTYRNSSWYKYLFETLECKAKIGAKYYEYKNYNCVTDAFSGKVIFHPELEFLIDELESFGYETSVKNVKSYTEHYSGNVITSVQLTIKW